MFGSIPASVDRSSPAAGTAIRRVSYRSPALAGPVELLPGFFYPAYRLLIIAVGLALAIGLYLLVARTLGFAESEYFKADGGAAEVFRLSPDEPWRIVRTRWRIAFAAEAAGLLAAALESVCTYTAERHQFGRPLASFQGMRHRLAEAQVRTNGVYWLAMKAAATLDPSDAAMAAFHAQESARVVVYDFHQFLGGMGMTLEHPLHLWTYRLKLLTGELGGRGANALAAAEALWG